MELKTDNLPIIIHLIFRICLISVSIVAQCSLCPFPKDLCRLDFHPPAPPSRVCAVRLK